LLLLDNVEHLLAAAPKVTDLLRACPQLKVLATSRDPLRVDGEWVVDVPPLALPEAATSLHEAATNPTAAVRLFVARAQAARHDFALTADNIRVVTAICRRLDGLPLAIELAAARLNALPPAALLARLERLLPTLTRGLRDAPARQQTMREAIAWSVDLLPLREQQLFRQLAVFVGGFGVEAAETVIGGLDDGGHVVDGIVALVDASLVRPITQPDGAVRYGMLETIREYGLEQLAANGEEEAVRAAHARWGLELADMEAQPLWHVARRSWIGRLEADSANLRSALAWAFAQGQFETGARLVLALMWFWFVRGPVSEGRAWLERVLAAGEALPGGLRVDALLQASTLAHRQRDAAVAATLATEGLALARTLGDARQIAQGQFQLGVASRMLGDLDQAVELTTAALRSFRSLGDAVATGYALKDLGLAAQAAGDRVRATVLLEEAVALARQEGAEWELASAVSVQAGLAQADADWERTAALAEEALHLFQVHGDRLTIADVLQRLAAVALHQGEPVAATRLLGATDMIRTEFGVPPSMTDRGTYRDALNAAQLALGADGFAHWWKIGGETPLDEIIAEALQIAQTCSLSAGQGRDAANGGSLTPRERDVLRLLAAGRTDREIAAALFIGQGTVRSHLTNIYGKLEVGSRTAAVATAHRLGLL
jgi:predicted ATPase/DNA-binding CsgD family transcriptional regulator